MAKNWFNITAKTGVADIYIYDEIGGFGVTAKSFIDEVRAFQNVRDIVLHVNSPGGNVFESFAIYNFLDSHPARVTAIVEGVAASAASYIIMAAEHIGMPDNAMLMLHDPAMLLGGGAGDLRNGAKLLDNVKESMVSAYAGKSGLARDKVVALMSAETWLTADEAKVMGFADEVREAVKVAAHFDLGRYEHPPTTPEPKSMGEAATTYWNKRNGKPVPVTAEDISDLVPAPESHEATWARWNSKPSLAALK